MNYKFIMLQVGLLGEQLQVYKEQNSETATEWTKIDISNKKPLTWYKVRTP